MMVDPKHALEGTLFIIIIVLVYIVQETLLEQCHER